MDEEIYQPEAKRRKIESSKKVPTQNQGQGEDHTISWNRETVVYSLDAGQKCLATNDHSDDFFDVNEADLKKRMGDLQNEAREQPPMTRAMSRQLEDTMAKYSRATIRVHFPSDKKILQGNFRPYETVGTLYEYVQSCLVDKAMSFYLYTTPPKTELKHKEQSLGQANLVPSAVVYFGCKDARRDQYLAPHMLKTKAEADEKVVKSRLPPDNI